MRFLGDITHSMSIECNVSTEDYFPDLHGELSIHAFLKGWFDTARRLDLLTKG